MKQLKSAKKLYEDTIERYADTKVWEMYKEDLNPEITPEIIYRSLFKRSD